MHLRKIVVGAALAAISVLPAVAGVVDDRFVRGGGCFVRKYDAAHLRLHPNQVVTQIGLELSPDQREPQRVALELDFTIRQGSHYSGTAYCAGDRCALEGDGGTFRLAADGKQVRLSVGDFLGLEGDTDFSPNLADSDDRVFLLNPC